MLTTRQRDILAFIGEGIAAGRPVSFQDICDEFGIASPNGAASHLKALAKKGLIRFGSRARSIEVVGLAEAIGPAVRAFMAKLIGGAPCAS